MKRCRESLLSEFIRQLELWGLALEDRQVASMERFGRLLESYSEANVIGARIYGRIMEEHILDSLSCLLAPGFDGGRRMVDVGTGGGLPGIPLKIARPSLDVSLIEATAKKAAFLRNAVSDLGLEDVKVLNARAEDVGAEAQSRASFDVATTRAVASVAVIAEYCVPLVRVGGQVVAMKGRVTREELEEGKHAARLLGARVVEVVTVPLLEEVRAEHRELVVLEKERETPARYPRKPGMARKRPLGTRDKGK